MSLPRGKEQGFETAIPDALPTAQAFIAAVSLGRLMHPGLASARGSPEDEAEFRLDAECCRVNTRRNPKDRIASWAGVVIGRVDAGPCKFVAQWHDTSFCHWPGALSKLRRYLLLKPLAEII